MHHLLEETPGIEFIWLIDEGVPGVIVQRNAYFSVVSYRKNGEEIIAAVENDEFETTGQIGYESN
jgi:hypothetical protein